MNVALKMILPMVLPKVQKEAAAYAADFLNRRRRQRLGLPEVEEAACPPCPLPAARVARGKALKNVLSVGGSILAGVVLGAGLGGALAKK